MLRFKRGDSVSWPATYKENGVPQDLGLIDIACEIRTKEGVLVVAFAIAKLNQMTYPGQYLLNLTPEVTSPLRPGLYQLDVQYTKAGVVNSTTSVPISIDVDQTA